MFYNSASTILASSKLTAENIYYNDNFGSGSVYRSQNNFGSTGSGSATLVEIITLSANMLRYRIKKMFDHIVMNFSDIIAFSTSR